MIKLETFVNEKLKITKSSAVPDLITLIESKDRKEFDSRSNQLLEYLKNDSDLPIADLEDFEHDLKKIDQKYQNRNDTFLWVYNGFIYYGTWDESYSTYWSRNNNIVKTITNGREGFKDFVCTNREIMQRKGVFIITENDDLMKQIDILKKKAELIS